MKKAYLIAPGRLTSRNALQWSYYLAKNLKKIGIDSVMIIISDKNENATYDGIRTIGIRAKNKNRHLEEAIFSLKTIPTIVRNRKNIYFLHANGFFPNVVTAIMAKILKIPCVVFCTDIVEDIYKSHGLPVPSIGSKLVLFLNRIYARNGDIIVTDSSPGKEWIIKEFHLKGDNILTTPHGFIPTIFYPRKKSESLVKKYKLEGKIVLGFHGGDYGYIDGIDILLESVKYLGNLRDKIRILLIGGGKGKAYESLQRKIKEMKLVDSVIFTGWVEDKMVPECLSLSDIYVVPWRSTKETNIAIPRKLIEAIGMGLPILSSEIRAVKNEFKNLKDVVFFEPGNPKDLAEKISYLIKNDNLRKRLAKRSSELREKYTWDAVTKKEILFLKERKILK